MRKHGSPFFTLLPRISEDPARECWKSARLTKIPPGSIASVIRKHRHASIAHSRNSERLDLVGWVTMENQSGKTFDNAPSPKRLSTYEHAGHARAFVFGVAAPRMRLGSDGHPRFLEQLHRLLIQTHHQKSRIIRLGVGVQQVSLARDKFAVRYPRPAME